MCSPRVCNQRLQGGDQIALVLVGNGRGARYSIRLVTGDAERRKVPVEYVTKGLASGALKPIIDRTFRFDETVEVHRYLENGGQFGKIVVTL
jgi:NADPH:quinone reductase-like Zn-dependent oxidoreductase